MAHQNPNTERSQPEDLHRERTAVDDLNPEQGIENVTFNRKNVLASADHQLEFFGSYTTPNETDDEPARTIEHEFAVYTVPDHRTADGQPTVVITEHVLRADDDRASGGDAALTEEQRFERVVDIDPGLDGRREETAIETPTASSGTKLDWVVTNARCGRSQR